MRTDMKKLVLMTAVLLGLVACNTVEGLGQDVSAGARAVDRAI
jgi:predicted small secreted protein